MHKYKEDLWMEKVKRYCDEGKSQFNVPLTALSRPRATKLAVNLGLTVFTERDNYVFITNKAITDALLKEADSLHW